MADEQRGRDSERPTEQHGDVDRAAILARRRRFILMALGGLSGVGGCRQVEPSPNPLEANEAASLRPPHEPVGPPPATVDAAPTPPPTSPPLRPISDEELQLMLQAPGKHRFAMVTGELAAAVGDCVKAWDFLEHYLAYGDYDKSEDHERVKALLDTPEMRACERPPLPDPDPDPDSYPMVCLSFNDPEPEPPAPPETKRQRREREGSERNAEREQERASKMFRRK